MANPCIHGIYHALKGIEVDRWCAYCGALRTAAEHKWLLPTKVDRELDAADRELTQCTVDVLNNINALVTDTHLQLMGRNPVVERIAAWVETHRPATPGSVVTFALKQVAADIRAGKFMEKL